MCDMCYRHCSTTCIYRDYVPALMHTNPALASGFDDMIGSERT